MSSMLACEDNDGCGILLQCPHGPSYPTYIIDYSMILILTVFSFQNRPHYRAKNLSVGLILFFFSCGTNSS